MKDDPQLSDLEKRVLIFLHLVNNNNYFPPAKIIARVLSVPEIAIGTAMTRLAEIGYVQVKTNDQAPEKAGYRAYIPDTSQEQRSMDEIISPSGGGPAPEGESYSGKDT